MNHTFLLFSSGIFACLLLSGCSGADLPGREDATVPLKVSAFTSGTSVVSRSVVSKAGTGSGEAGEIGVFLTLSSDGHSAYADLSISSAIFKVDNAGKWNASRPVNLRSESARLYAWYPVASGGESKPADNGSTRTVAVSTPASQTFDGASATACSQTDYLYGSSNSTVGDATAITVNRANNSPTIWLQHALAQVVFTIEYKASRLPDDEYDFVKSISLQGPFRAGSGTMQLNDGTLSLPTGNTTLTFTAESSPQLPGRVDKPAVVAYGLVAPRSATAATVTVNLVLGQSGNDTHNRTLTATTTTLFGAAWEKGIRYTYHLLLDKNDLTFRSVEIGGWDDVNKGSTDMPPVLE
ncbi:MAG: fimbrillin family protein [Bacteroides sp.]|nr:fimbrillin family protein [Bacteroides sp.]